MVLVRFLGSIKSYLFINFSVLHDLSPKRSTVSANSPNCCANIGYKKLRVYDENKIISSVCVSYMFSWFASNTFIKSSKNSCSQRRKGKSGES